MNFLLPRPLLQHWQALAPRERRALGWLALVLGIALVVQVLWSMETQRQKLREQLPHLQQQQALMAQSAEAWQKLSPPFPTRPKLGEPAVQKEILGSAGELGAGLKMTWSPGEILKIQGRTDFDRWLIWVGRIQQDYGLRIEEAGIHPLGQGQVELEVRMVGEMQ